LIAAWVLAFCPGWVLPVAGEILPVLPAEAVPKPPVKVFYALDLSVLGPDREPDRAIVRRMVDALVRGVTARPSAASAWRTLVSPTDVVGIKVSTAAGPIGGTKPAVVEAVAAGLREAGIPRERILVWDRNKEDLLTAGFRTNSGLYTLRWINPADGYDKKAQVSAPVLGKLVWGDRAFGILEDQRSADLMDNGEQLSNRSFFAGILSRDVTKVIHIPSATDSFLTGINGALADMTLSNLDNWRRFVRAPDHGDPYLAEIYSDPMIREKVVLTLLDALVLQYAGGPGPNPNFTSDNMAVFASRDPVAIDATLLEMLEELRKQAKLPPLAPMTRYIQSATQLGLGEHSPARIESVRAGIDALR